MNLIKIIFIIIISFYINLNVYAEPVHKNDYDVVGQVNIPTGVIFNPSGTKMYVTGFTGNSGRVAQYSLSVPYSTSSGVSLDANTITEIAAVLKRPQDIKFNSDGSKVLVLSTKSVDGNQDSIAIWSLGTPYDITTISSTKDSEDFLNIDNKKFYIKSDINIDDDSFNTISNRYSFKKIRFLYIVGPHFQYAHKNFRDFINAMLYFKETNINFEINITLTEEECNNSNLWDNSLNEYTNFHGYISNKDKLRELYSDDTILISTSIIETLGLHVVDGIKNGIITISPNEDYANVVYGPESYKYELYSNESLVNVVKDVINNKSSLNEKIILQQEYLKFNEKKKYKNIIEVFNEVLDV